MNFPPTHPTLLSAFEQAANDVQVASTRLAAEQTLATLTALPDSISLACAVLDSSNSPVARFHAAATLRTAIHERWHTLPPQHRYGPNSLRHSLITTVISKPNLLLFERIAILRTVAFLTRQAYLEESPPLRDAYFALICDSASSPQSPPHSSLTAIELIDLILDEFTTPSLPNSHLANSIDREIFVRARLIFASPQGHIIPLLHAAFRLLGALASSMPAESFPSQSFSIRASPALSVIHRILTTEFRNAPISLSPDHSSIDPLSYPSQENLEAVIINSFKTPEWHSLIDQIPHILNLSFSIVAALIAAPSPNPESDLFANPLHIVTAIAAISRTSYPSPESASSVLLSVMTGLEEQKWSACPIGPIRLAYAEVWRRASCSHGLSNLELLPINCILMFTNDTCQQMDAAAAKLPSSDPDDDVLSMDVIDLLLETWVNLALQADDGQEKMEHPHSNSIERVVLHFIRMSLRTTGDAAAAIIASGIEAHADLEEDLGFDDTSLDESRLSVAAILARFVLEKTVPALVQSLLQAADKVFKWPHGHSSVNGLPLDMYQEDLFFLIQLTCSILTDEAKGEYPSVPNQFILYPVHGSAANGHPKPKSYAQALMAALFEVAERESRFLNERGVHCNEASPRVSSSLLTALARLVRTYLAPLNTSNAAIAFEVIGGPIITENGRNYCFLKAMEGITMRGFESDVTEASAHLLATLAMASKSYPELREGNTWQSLLLAGVEAFQTLSPKAVQDVGKSITSVLGDVVAEKLVIPAYHSLHTISNGRDQLADAAERAIATINLLQGVARCDTLGGHSRHALLRCLQAPDGVAAICAKAFGRTRPDVSRTMLKLADDVVYNSLPLLSQNDGRDLLSNVLTLIKIHVDIISAHGNGLSHDDVVGDIEDLLLLLTHILDEEVDVDVGEACFYGLSTILPLMNEAMLDIPSVHQNFFRFVAQLVSAHAEKLSLLPVDFCSKILQSLDMQRTSYDAGSERKALEAITALARTRALTPNAMSKAIQNHDQNRRDGISIVDNALHQFLIRIFDAIAKGSAHTTNLDAAADALLPLVHVHYEDSNGATVSAFEQVGQALVSSSGNNADLRIAIVELGRVASEAGIAYGFGNTSGTDAIGSENGRNRMVLIQATRRFREAVANFSNEARNCLVSVAIGATTT